MTEDQEIEFIIEDDENDLTMYSYISNYLCFEYFVGYEIAALLGYKNTRDVIIKNVSKSNQLEFRDYPGVKEPALNPKTILISSDGVIEILLKTRKRISPDVLHILKKFNIDTTNRKCLTKEQQTLSTIANVFKTEKYEDQFKIGKYYLDLYFSEYKICVECDENGHSDRKPHKERERMDFVNKNLEIDDDNWIRFNPDEHDFDMSKVIGQIYRKINEIKDKDRNKVVSDENKNRTQSAIKELNVYYHTENGVKTEYFIAYEIVKILGYRQVNEIIKYVSKDNRIEFRDYKGERNPRINPKAMLITRKGVNNILIKTMKYLAYSVVDLFIRYRFNIKIINNKVTIISENEEEDEVNTQKEEININQDNNIINNIKNAFVYEEYIENFEIKDKYKVDLYFPDYKIILDLNNVKKDDILNINDFLKINDTFWIRYENDSEQSKIIGQIFSLMKIKGKVVFQVCAGCNIKKELNEYHKNSYNPLKVEYKCKICRSEENKKRLENNREKLEEITEKYCEKCEKTLSISEFWKSINFKDGFYKFCKNCGKDHRKNQYEENKKEPEEFRKCTKCEIIKNKEEYGKNLESYDGLNTICIPCYKKITNKRYNENKIVKIESKPNILGIYYDNDKNKYFIAAEVAKLIGYNRTDYAIKKISENNKFFYKDIKHNIVQNFKINPRSTMFSTDGLNEFLKIKVITDEKILEKIRKMQDVDNVDEILIIDNF